jgi:hypothetical protein
MAKLTKDKYVFSSFESCHFCTSSFDVWMSRVEVDTFVMIVHFLNDQWEPCHITVGYFEIVDITENAMAL